jgi:hypothetical protein
MRLGTSFSAKAPVLSTTRGSFGHEGQAHGLAAGRDDGALECDDLLGAGLLLGRAGGFFHFEVVGTDEVTVAADGGDLAHLGHGSQAAGQLADDLFFVAAQLVDVDHGRTEVNTPSRPCG